MTVLELHIILSPCPQNFEYFVQRIEVFMESPSADAKILADIYSPGLFKAKQSETRVR